jgi:predicted O-linked N-acetylglucosamine transferase (SPINDLY family)
MPSEFFIKYVRSLNIDVFIELTGLSPGNRHLEMKSRLAPVQISYMNHTATTGIDNIDYLLADNNCILENEYKYFSEKILMLQNCFFCFNYERDTYFKQKAVFKTKNSIEFGVFGSYEKLNPELIRMYATLVKKIPDSKIIFKNTRLREQKAKNILKEILRNEGLNGKQFALNFGGNREDILDSYSAIDISLDTFPYNGGNTIAESLHMGTIPISLKGNRFSSRYGSSILQFSNLEQYVAVDEVSFIQKAISLSNDKQKRKWAKNEMPFQLQKTFFNKAKFGDNFFSCLSKI